MGILDDLIDKFVSIKESAPYIDQGLGQAALDDAISRARKDGFTVERTDSKTLLLDLDTSAQWCQFKRILPILREHYPIAQVIAWPSKSSGVYPGAMNSHVKISHGHHMEVVERYALQSILGSDPVKEILNLKRIAMGIKEPSVLFRPKGVKTETL